MFACIRNKKIIEILEPEEINEVFELADVLCAPQWLMRKLTLHGQKLLPKDQQHEKIACGHYLNSIRSLYDTGRLKDKLENIEYNDEYQIITGCTLNLCNNELDSLNGIELLGKKYQKVFVKALNIEKNKLQKLNLLQLFEVFPELQCIRAYHNHISEIELPDRLPDKVFLNLQRNRITELPDFKVGEKGIIILTGNQLTP